MAKSYVPHMHTAEHILNGTMVAMFGCDRCYSAHINTKKSKCDYTFDRPITDEEAETLQSTVNTQLRRNLEVTEEIMPLEQAKKQYNLSRLPSDDITTIRIVHVGDYDSCPCIGEHVQNTSEIGEFTINSYDFENGRLRIRFKCKSAD
ncbi:hypothetical protein [Halodesulfovibrio sp.]|jgi:Ser-tRNA(Ala) deacylase AlaX|uniref:hypothetical protein n=1 Tax=Halodesulfovibrio sp. TaxID=1912772 RepID=UPI002600EB4D|nr:hypothetical protein [Halodesulfovibrio sp.]MCT4534388.1 hypothetical protein [Halodesulfovibrio sp.]MCT4625719.1 hypothetical protein [Halodesulfovibrio sp.]